MNVLQGHPPLNENYVSSVNEDDDSIKGRQKDIDYYKIASGRIKQEIGRFARIQTSVYTNNTNVMSLTEGNF